MTEPKKVVVDYKIVACNSAFEQSTGVKKLIDSGWELYGGISVAVSDSGPFYAQAMVRKEDEDTRGAWG